MGGSARTSALGLVHERTSFPYLARFSNPGEGTRITDEMQSSVKGARDAQGVRGGSTDCACVDVLCGLRGRGHGRNTDSWPAACPSNARGFCLSGARCVAAVFQISRRRRRCLFAAVTTRTDGDDGPLVGVAGRAVARVPLCSCPSRACPRRDTRDAARCASAVALGGP